MNRFIAEKVMNEHYHTPFIYQSGEESIYKCADSECEFHDIQCIIPLHQFNPDYTNPADYYALLMFAIGSEWWEDFYRKTWREWHRKQDAWSISRDARHVQWLLAPENFARLVAEYHGWKEEGK